MKTEWDHQFARPSEETPWVAHGIVDDVSYHTRPKLYSEGEWVHLERHSENGCDYWVLPRDGHGGGTTASPTLGRDLEGQLLSVRWPDGSITKSWIGMDLLFNKNSDWPGTNSPVYWVGVNINGIGMKVNIENLQFDEEEIKDVPFTKF